MNKEKKTTSDISFVKYDTYDDYISHQKSKAPPNSTLHKQLSKGGAFWDRDILGWREIFNQYKELIKTFNNSLCLGARTGQEVFILKEMGLTDSIGIDLHPDPPLVIEGDVHNLKFKDSCFDFVFSNIFDHVLYPEKFISEIERVTKRNGYCLLHLDNNPNSDEYAANILFNPDFIIDLFERKVKIIKNEPLKIKNPWLDHREILIKFL